MQKIKYITSFLYALWLVESLFLKELLFNKNVYAPLMNKLIPIQKMSFLFHLRIFLLDYTELIYLVGIVLTLVWGTWKANKVVDSLMFIFIFIIFELRFRIYVFEYYFIVTIFFLVLLSRSWNYEKKMYRYLSITYILFVLSGYFFNGLYMINYSYFFMKLIQVM